MPHYRNGTPAALGDLVINAPPYPNTPQTLGIIVSITPGASSCNGQVISLAKKFADGAWREFRGNGYPECITLGECDKAIAEPDMRDLPAEDVAVAT